jgi:hypothetical protein
VLPETIRDLPETFSAQSFRSRRVKSGKRPELLRSGILKDGIGVKEVMIQAIIETHADIVATGCPGCRLQIHGNLEDDHIQVMHPVEILAMAMA